MDFLYILLFFINIGLSSQNETGQLEVVLDLVKKQQEVISTMQKKIAELETRQQMEASRNRRLLLNSPMEQVTQYQRMPVAFYAYLTTTISGLGTHQPIAFNHVHINEGNGYSPSIGEFLAPVNGTYFFTWTISNTDRTALETEIVKDNTIFGQIFSDAGNHDDYTEASASAITRLNAGDRVWIRVGKPYSGIVGANELTWPSFSGFLIH